MTLNLFWAIGGTELLLTEMERAEGEAVWGRTLGLGSQHTPLGFSRCFLRLKRSLSSSLFTEGYSNEWLILSKSFSEFEMNTHFLLLSVNAVKHTSRFSNVKPLFWDCPGGGDCEIQPAKPEMVAEERHLLLFISLGNVWVGLRMF